MINMFNKISTSELDLIETYINLYGKSSWANPIREDMAPLDYILRFWSENKKNLFQILGNELTVSKEICYEKNESELIDMLSEKYYEPNSLFRQFQNEYIEVIDNNYKNTYDYFNLTQLTTFSSLVRNKWDGGTIEINIPNSTKTLKLERSGKIMKFLQKFAEAYNIKCFEEFRIIHSAVLNEKKLKGKLVLSIHPLDYMTMSDNWNDWSSCMSWMDEGCYRQGTVEMMNSPCVVVAYLESNTTQMEIQGHKWNSKKWRELFIVTPEIITGVLGYPYNNSDLSLSSLNFIKELIDKNSDWKYEKEITEYRPWDFFDTTERMNLKFSPCTDFMYNDFESGGRRLCYIGEIVPKTDYEIDLKYSGPSECMICGNTNITSEKVVICSECAEYCRCEHCGEHITIDDAYVHNGHYYCEYCVDDFDDCVRCDETLYPYDKQYSFEIIFDSYSIYRDICKNCFDQLNKKATSLFKRNKTYKTNKYNIRTFCINVKDLTRKGKIFFDII